MAERTKYILDESEMPTTWYNVVPDLPSRHRHRSTPAPSSRSVPTTSLPVPHGPHRPGGLRGRYIDIPGAVLDVYTMWRPTPLYRAHRLEKALDTPASIYFKYEGVSPAGSHKPNTAVPQAYYNAEEGSSGSPPRRVPGKQRPRLRLQHLRGLRGMAGARFVRPEAIPEGDDGNLGATVHPSPSDLTEAGRKILADNPDSPGSLGIAISEAVEAAVSDPATHYAGERAQPRADAPDSDRGGGTRPARLDG